MKYSGKDSFFFSIDQLFGVSKTSAKWKTMKLISYILKNKEFLFFFKLQVKLFISILIYIIDFKRNLLIKKLYPNSIIRNMQKIFFFRDKD
jgi:hypothetical protein